MPWVALVVAAAAAKKKNDQQAAQQKFEADLAGDAADREQKEGRNQAASFRRQRSRLLARSRALRAGSGVSLNAGSPLLVDADTAAEIELGAQTILSNSSKRVFDFRLQRNLLRVASINTKAAGPLDAGQSGTSAFLAAGGSFGGSKTPSGDTGAGPQFTGTGSDGLRSSGSF